MLDETRDRIFELLKADPTISIGEMRQCIESIQGDDGCDSHSTISEKLHRMTADEMLCIVTSSMLYCLAMMDAPIDEFIRGLQCSNG